MPPALARRSSSKTVAGSAAEVLAVAEPVGQRLQDLGVGAHARGRSACCRRRRRTRPSRLVIVPSSSAHCATGQHDVGQLGRLGEEEVADHQQVERAQALGAAARVGRRDHQVERHAPAAPAPRRRACSSSSVAGTARAPGSVAGVHAPDRGDVGAVPGIVELAVAGQLVGLLPVLAPALAVALAGQAAPAAKGRPTLPSASARLMKPRTVARRSLVLLLRPASGQDARPRGPRPASRAACGTRRSTRAAVPERHQRAAGSDRAARARQERATAGQGAGLALRGAGRAHAIRGLNARGLDRP